MKSQKCIGTIHRNEKFDLGYFAWEGGGGGEFPKYGVSGRICHSGAGCSKAGLTYPGFCSNECIPDYCTYYIVENLYERPSVKPWPIKWQHAPHE